MIEEDWNTSIAEPEDDDFISVENQKAMIIGPDYDPDYSTKLNKLIEDAFGPLGDFVPIEEGK